MSDQPVVQYPTTLEENRLLVLHFKDNENLLKVMRRALYGFDLGEEQKKLLSSTFKSKALLKAVRKKIYPLLNEDFLDTVPIGVVADFWSGTENNILGAHPDQIKQVIMSKQETLSLLGQGIERLANPGAKAVNLDYTPLSESEDLALKLLARNLYIRTIETGLSFIKVTAEKFVEETKEEKEEGEERQHSVECGIIISSMVLTPNKSD